MSVKVKSHKRKGRTVRSYMRSGKKKSAWHGFKPKSEAYDPLNPPVAKSDLKSKNWGQADTFPDKKDKPKIKLATKKLQMRKKC